MRCPVSTYRLQLHAGFTFDDASNLTEYLDTLGITDVYASPFLKASPGSLHGYDICDHGSLNPDIGDDQSFAHWTEALARRGMGLILDFVPNHMGLDSKNNPWWRSVLTHGPSSPYASYFDIDWRPMTPELHGRVLLPILQEAYGDALERGDLHLDYRDGEFIVRYFDRDLPLDPKSMGILLQAIGAADEGEAPPWVERVQVVLDVLAGLPDFRAASVEDGQRRTRMSAHAIEQIAHLVEDTPELRSRISRVLDEWNGTSGLPESFDRLHALLELQPYRLAYWRTALDEINYRRFFDVNDLGGLCMEAPRVFEETHRLVLPLIGQGLVTGMRIDHPDGLFDPGEYLRRLQEAAQRALVDNTDITPGSASAGELPFYVLVEKILTDQETLPDDWPVAGTTGYGFLNVVNGLFVDQSHERDLTRTYEHIVYRREPFETIAYRSKRLITTSSLASELAVLTRALKLIAASDRTTRDFTLNALERALVETVACFPVYRTYITQAGFTATARDAIDSATDRARRRNPVVPSSVFLFLRRVLLSEAAQAPAGPMAEQWLRVRRRFASKFQQFSAPVEAKGIEDTAFYQYVPLLSLNEVGGDPSRFGRSVEEFHAGNRVRLEHWPFEMNATATHDAKRGEDARTRIDVASELPDVWRQAVSTWMRMNGRRRTVVDGELAPDRNDEYLYYQCLLGAWPCEPLDAPVPVEAPPEFVQRLGVFMQKAIREAKRHTSWVSQQGAYDDAMLRFVEASLTGTSARAFLSHFVPLARRFAAIGAINSLSQLVLKMTSPGVPDFYQGTELWHLSLADPDNRAPVDFASRRAILEALDPWIDRAVQPGSCAEDSLLRDQVRDWLREWPDGRIKLFVTACGLRLRRQARDLMWHGGYDGLRVTGVRASNVVATMRSAGRDRLITLAGRLIAPALWGRSWPADPEFWKDTLVRLPPELAGSSFRNIITGEVVASAEDQDGTGLAARAVFRVTPVALLRIAQNPNPA